MTNADKLTDFAINKLNEMFDVVSKTLPTATKYVLETTRMDCLIQFLPLAYIIPVLCLATYVYYKSIKKIWAMSNPEAIFWLTALSSVPYLAVHLWFWSTLLQGWQWVCVFHPDLYLIHLAIQKVTG